MDPIPVGWGVQEKIDVSHQKQKGATCTETPLSPHCPSAAASAKAMPQRKKPCFLFNKDPDRHQSSSSDSESNMAASAPQEKTQQISDRAYAAFRVPAIPILARSNTTPQAFSAATQQVQAFVRWRERSREPLRQMKCRPAVCLIGEKQPDHGRVAFRLYDCHDANCEETMDSKPPDLTNLSLDWSAPVSLKIARAEARRRWMRNKMIKTMLQRGNMVQYVSGGHSLHPDVQSGDCCLFYPVCDRDLLNVGDIVFCEVQPANNMMAHKITHIGFWQQKNWIRPKRYFEIGNNADPPRVNGWCHDEHIYGRMMECLGPVPS